MAFAAGAFSLPAQAQQVDLRYNLPAGSSIRSQDSQSFTIAGRASDQWGNQQEIKQSFGGKIQYQMEVLGDNAGVPNHVKLAFEPNLTFTFSDGFQQQSEPMAFSGKTYEVNRANGGFQLKPQDGLDPDSQSYIQEITENAWSSLLPGRPVAIGESWQPDSSTYLRAGGFDQGSTVQINAKLVNVAQQNGRTTAELELEFNLNGSSDGIPLRGAKRGKAFIDVATGVAVSVNLEGKLPLEIQGPEGRLNGQCIWIVQHNSSVLNVPANPIDLAHDKAIQVIRGDEGHAKETEHVDEDSGGNGPSINGQTAPPFAGTFSNNQLSVTLIESPDDGRRTIEIVRGDIRSQGYLTGNRNINMSLGDNGAATFEVTFQGKFAHGDSEFDFNAKQTDRERLFFTTGSTTHELTLDKPKASNPFE